MVSEKQGWFHTAGRLGDRSLDQQLMALDWLLENCRGKTVLDLGCAEGLISIEVARAGAASVHGLEIVPGHVDVANRLRGDLPVTFEVGNLNSWRPAREFDIVLALSVLHKLVDPSAAARDFARTARHAIVFRTPPKDAPSIVDWRSQFVPHPVGAIFLEMGFELVRGAHDGPFGEWVGVYVRRA